MLDLKTVKNITISEGSVTKITNSSGVVLWQKETGSSASLDIDLNNQWIASTKTLDGYRVYMSNSNHHVNNGYASMKFKFKGQPNFKLWINSYAHSNYDYTVAWNLDVDYPTKNPSSSTSGVKANTSGKQYNPTNITAFTEVDYANDGGEHFVVVTYRKDRKINANDDRGYVAIKLTLISTTWVLSSTEFVKKDDKYYEKINEVGTYEGGVTLNTGNYKEGNELAVTYKQGTADDYILVGSKMYYKKYAYVTPKDQEINTGDYIQGDYIGEATPAMKVTYKDNTEKTFYNLTSIERNTDPNKVNAKEVEIYNSVTNIGKSAFNGCSSLTSVTIPDSVTSIGNAAFKDCSSLTSVTIPDSVTSIDGYAFWDCSGLTSVTIPDSVTSIDNGTFDGCSSLTSVTIENSSSKLGYNYYAFANIAPFAKLYVPSNLLSDYQADSAWTDAFGGGIFAIVKNETVVTYADGTTKEFAINGEIRDISIENKANATKVEIGTGVTTIGWAAFDGCSKLESATIPSSVTNIKSYAFRGCSKLSSINIPDSVTKNGDYLFQNCTNLTEVTIGSGATDLGYASYSGCTSLKTMTVKATTPPTLVEGTIPVTIQTIYVPADSVDAYKSQSEEYDDGYYGWENFYFNIKAIGS